MLKQWPKPKIEQWAQPIRDPQEMKFSKEWHRWNRWIAPITSPSALWERWLRRIIGEHNYYLVYRFRRRIQQRIHKAKYLCQYLFVFRRYRYPPEWRKFRTRPRDIRRSIAGRKQGISGFVRLYNEENGLKSCICSHLPYFDELVLICDGNSTDRSWEICEELHASYPDKIKIYSYSPRVYPYNTLPTSLLPHTHPQSQVNYSNYALLKTSYDIVAKIDADLLIIDEPMQQLIAQVHTIREERNRIVTPAAIDLWYNEDKDEVMVDPKGWFSAYCDQYYLQLVKRPDYYVSDMMHSETPNFVGLHRPRYIPPLAVGVTQFHLKKSVSIERFILKSRLNAGKDAKPDSFYRESYLKRREQRISGSLSWDQFMEWAKTPRYPYFPNLYQLPDADLYVREKAPEWVASKGRQS